MRQRRGRPRKRPDKLHADKAYDFRRCRDDLRRRGMKPRIARRGVDSSQTLGCHRWVAERTFAWINQFRRLRPLRATRLPLPSLRRHRHSPHLLAVSPAVLLGALNCARLKTPRPNRATRANSCCQALPAPRELDPDDSDTRPNASCEKAGASLGYIAEAQLGCKHIILTIEGDTVECSTLKYCCLKNAHQQVCICQCGKFHFRDRSHAALR